MSLRSKLKLPKEHGAWAMVYVPFVLGVAVAGTVNLAVLLLLLATSALFISRESLLVWWRARKRGRQTQSATDSQRLLLIYLTVAALTGLPLMLVYKFYGLLLFGLLAAAMLVLNGWKATDFEDRTVQSELLAIAGMTMTAPAAYYVASGQWGPKTFWLWALSAAYFASSVFYVKLRVTGLHAKHPDDKQRARWQCVTYHGFLLVSLLALAITQSLSLFSLIAFAPVLARTAWSLGKPSNQLNLKQIGIAEIIYSLIFLVFTVVTLRVS
ncbi:MAG: YwiC-like family protein [Acidobacteria bacterium]|nr:YwiC-like family protein [Acidobacteriota bacterium]